MELGGLRILFYCNNFDRISEPQLNNTEKKRGSESKDRRKFKLGNLLTFELGFSWEEKKLPNVHSIHGIWLWESLNLFFFLGSSHHPLTHSCWTETKRKKNKNIIINIKIQLGLVIFFSNSMIKPATGMHILRITSVIPVRPTVTLCAKSDSKVTDFSFKFFLRVDFSIDWCNKLSLRHVFLKLETSRIFFHVTPLKPWPFPFSFSRRFFSLSFPFTHEIL